MIKVTVLYNLPEGTDEAEFVRWRTTEHNRANMARPGVLKGDFYRAVGQAGVGTSHQRSDASPWRFMTEAYYPDRETFEAAWYAPEEQERLVPAVAKIRDAMFIISEELQTTEGVGASGERTALTEREALDLLAFLVASAETCTFDPTDYGQMRLLSAAAQLMDAMRDHGLGSPWLEAFRQEVAEKSGWIMWDRAGYEQFLSGATAGIAAELRRRAAGTRGEA
ncbi:MAG: hypothetical protein DCC58_01430 [Chloroflexi bacterium]|nr:MAG: hypothetical protein DCC58_01430 [Chloroflexota bacterium]